MHIPRSVQRSVLVHAQTKQTEQTRAISMNIVSACRYVRLNALNVMHAHGSCFNAPKMYLGKTVYLAKFHFMVFCEFISLIFWKATEYRQGVMDGGRLLSHFSNPFLIFKLQKQIEEDNNRHWNWQTDIKNIHLSMKNKEMQDSV